MNSVNNLVKNQLGPLIGPLVRSQCRFKHHKTPEERLPAFIRYQKPNIPLKNERSMYSEEEKLQLWSKVRPSDLSPPFFQFTKEERDKLGLEHLENVAYIPGQERTKEPEVDASEMPYNEIYADGEDHQNFTSTTNILKEEPERWYWVQRLLPSPLHKKQVRSESDVPETCDISTFVPPPSKPPKLPYFVPRTRNNLLPVYKVVDYKDQKGKTSVRNVTGDIWALEKELHKLLEPLSKERILSAVNEVTGEIRFMGTYHRQIAEHLIKIGF